MAFDVTVRIVRKMFPQTYMGRVHTEYKTVDKQMFLPDEVRFAMAGEPEVWFEADQEGTEIVAFKKRIPKPEHWKADTA